MKKVLIIFALGFMFISAFAQEKIHAGIKAGVTASDIYNNESVISDPRLGFSGGAFIAFPIGKYFGIQPEAIYTQRAMILKGSSNGSNYSITRTTGHVDIPFYFQFRPIKFISVVGGPQFSFLLDKNDQFRDGRLTDEQKREIVESDVRNGTVGVSGGVDINIGILVLSGRVGCDLQSNTIEAGTFSPSYNNKWTQLMIGFRI